ncbi:unnamed protein product [Brassica rapa]|uniref:Uncharacterized protein n=2 Tax=Brassica TaxID=3705 RepID=A0A8D9HUH0_BRACM|nr:unnamed protein product [Brassica napus]CAG7906120.1 unnamed protein product [Brassica rapa]
MNHHGRCIHASVKFFFWSNVYVSFEDYICNTMLVVIILQFPLHVSTTHNKFHVVEHDNHVLLIMSRRVTSQSVSKTILISPIKNELYAMEPRKTKKEKRKRKMRRKSSPAINEVFQKKIISKFKEILDLRLQYNLET